MAEARKSQSRGLFSPAYYNAPPGPPLALGAALAIWLFARTELVTTLMALLVALLVGLGYVRARREAIEARRALAAAQARLAVLEQGLRGGMDVAELKAAALRGAEMIGAAAPSAPPQQQSRAS
ncbi:MAG: hypothetical protein AB7L65_01090 [Hyphomonadaceae bacterium]